MKDMGIIQGSAEQAVPLIVGKDTVYVHTDIEQVLEDHEGNPVENLFEFHEVQYEKDEYIKIMTETNQNLGEQVTDLQIALVEIYEGMVV